MFRHGLGRPGCRAAAAGGTAGDAHVVGPWAGAAAHCAVEPTIFVGLSSGICRDL